MTKNLISQHWELIKLIRYFLIYILGKLKGLEPICDRCIDYEKYYNKISFLEYIFNRKGNHVYCRLCWNWIHLKTGTCKKCKNSVKHRDKWGVKVKVCQCNGIIELQNVE